MISSDNIILSLEKIESSAKNTFKGKVIKINKKVSMVEITVDIGVNLIVYVTYSSFNKMAIENNKEVFVTFKATAVHIF
jgi:molybdate/tungstate transport system ATP-binding protein